MATALTRRETVPVALAGSVVHLTLSAGFGVLFASIMERDARRRASTMLLAAMAYGCGLWLVSFHVIAPFAGWEWFPRRSDPLAQLVAHAVFYAPVLGLYLHRIESRARDPHRGERADDRESPPGALIRLRSHRPRAASPAGGTLRAD